MLLTMEPLAPSCKDNSGMGNTGIPVKNEPIENAFALDQSVVENQPTDNQSLWNQEPVVDDDDNTEKAISKIKPRRESTVFQHFTKEVISTDCVRAKCHYCDKSFAYISKSINNGTSHLRRHLACHHGLAPGDTDSVLDFTSAIVKFEPNDQTVWDLDPVAVDNTNIEKVSFTRNQRQRSTIYEEFTEEIIGPDCKRLKCKHCNKSMAYITNCIKVGTSHLRRHIALHQKASPNSYVTYEEEQGSDGHVPVSKRRKVGGETDHDFGQAIEGEDSLLLHVQTKNASMNFGSSLAGNNQEPLKVRPYSARDFRTSLEVPIPDFPSTIAESFSNAKPYSNVQTKSRNLIEELASRNRPTQSSLFVGEISNAEPIPSSDFLRRQRDELSSYLNTSLENIHQFDFFNNIKRIIRTLLQHNTDDSEKKSLEKVLSCAVKFEKSIPEAISNVETAKTITTCLTETREALDGKLNQRQDQLCSLEAQVSALSDEELKLEAEIQRLMSQKEGLVTRKNLAIVELEKLNQEAAKDLEKWKNTGEKLDQAKENFLKGKEELAQANTSWRLLKENLGL